MDNRRSILIIEQLRRQWIRTAVATNVLLTLSVIAILFLILVKFLSYAF